MSSNNNNNHFKQQTIILLKQQSNKLKLLNAQVSSKQQQLAIKQQQIKFFKQTIVELQGENEMINRQRDQTKIKLDKIMQEINVYNQQVVKPICVERESLRKENNIYKQKLSQYQKQLQQLKSTTNKQSLLVQQLQSQQLLLNTQLKQYQITHLQHQQQLQQYKNKQKHYQKQIQTLQKQLTQQSLIKERLSVQLGTVNKQLNTVIGKYNAGIKQYQHKLNTIMVGKVDQQEMKKLQQEIKTKEKQILLTKQQNSTLIQLHEQYRMKSLSQRQRLSKQLTKQKLFNQQLKIDLTNIKKSIQISKKVIEFQSQESEMFYQLYGYYERLVNNNQELQESLENTKEEIQKSKLDNQKLKQALQNKQIQQTLIKTHFQQNLQRLQSQYEGKLLSLNVKIRQQQDALQRIKKNELQMQQHNDSLKQQLMAITQQFTSYKSTTEQSLNKLNQENYKIVTQMQQVYQICQENLNNKRNLDRVKMVVHSLLIALYFMKDQLQKCHEKQTTLYLPIVESFLKIKKEIVENCVSLNLSGQKEFSFITGMNNKITNTNKNIKPQTILKSTKISQIKKSIYAVIAIIRLKKTLQRKSFSSKQKDNLSGISLLMMRSLQTRNKIPNMVELLQKQTQIYQECQQVEQTILQLLKVTNNAFTWPDSKVQKLQINTDKYLCLLKMISSNNEKKQ